MGDLLTVHRRLLEEWRTRTNLVGPGPIDPHYADSADAIRPLTPFGHWADLGTGAGFPGIVFADRFPTVAVDLVDNRKKRCQFLEAVLAAAGTAVTERPAPLRVLCTHLERLPPGSYDGVLARALAAPDLVVAHADRLLKSGGLCVLFLQGEADVPIARGFELVHIETYAFGERTRKSVTLRKR